MEGGGGGGWARGERIITELIISYHVRFNEKKIG